MHLPNSIANAERATDPKRQSTEDDAAVLRAYRESRHERRLLVYRPASVGSSNSGQIGDGDPNTHGPYANDPIADGEIIDRLSEFRPDLTKERIEAAFARLTAGRFLVGPADDRRASGARLVVGVLLDRNGFASAVATTLDGQPDPHLASESARPMGEVLNVVSCLAGILAAAENRLEYSPQLMGVGVLQTPPVQLQPIQLHRALDRGARSSAQALPVEVGTVRRSKLGGDKLDRLLRARSLQAADLASARVIANIGQGDAVQGRPVGEVAGQLRELAAALESEVYQSAFVVPAPPRTVAMRQIPSGIAVARRLQESRPPRA